jgi:hypothetical protein
MDWLLLGIFFFMSIAIVSHANLTRDSLTILVATLGGLAIESWGTQTNLWHYYTAERPPLWIIPAWPIATLTITRMVRLLKRLTSKAQSFSFLSSAKKFRNLRLFVFNSKTLYRIIFPAFYALMLAFVAPTLEKTYTLLSLLLVALLILTPVDYRTSLLIFLAGAGLGYFLELWGTTRECWTYYTNQKPPLFAVLAHGMAAVAFWRTELLLKKIWLRLAKKEIA